MGAIPAISPEVCGCSTRIIIEVTHYVPEEPVIIEGGAENGYTLPLSNWDPSMEKDGLLIHPISEPIRNRRVTNKFW